MLRFGRFGWVVAGTLALFSCSDGSSSEAETASAAASLSPSYAFTLAARSSEDPGDSVGAFQVPAGSLLKDMTPRIGDGGDVVLYFRGDDDLQRVWKNGKIVHTIDDDKAVITGTSVNSAGDIAFDVMGADSGNGVWMLHSGAPASFYSSEPLGADSWIGVKLTDDGRVGCRPGSEGRHFLGFPDADGFAKVAVDHATNPNSPYSYLYTPSFDRHGNVATKVTLTAGGDQYLVFKPGAPAAVLAADMKADPASPYKSLDNGVALNERGQIAFIAKSNGKRGVFRVDANAKRTTKIALEGENDIASISFFNPAMDASGRVVFKGEDTKHRNVIWAGNGKALERVVTAGDALPSDKGDVLALPETEFDPSNRIVFGGDVSVNAQGDIVFEAALAKQNEAGMARLGTGVYVAKRTR